MENQESIGYKLWNGKLSLSILLLVVIGCTVLAPGIGAVGAFLVAIIAIIVARKSGSLADIGMRMPESCGKLICITLLYGIVIQLSFLIFFDPLFERITGTTIDISSVDAVRGSIPNFIAMLAIGWIVGGFLEELTFRGFILTRVRRIFGEGNGVIFLAMLVSAVPFGIAHMYQDWAGVLSTGSIGFILAAVYVRHNYNLWYAVLTHGFINTVAITLIYLDIDQKITHLLF